MQSRLFGLIILVVLTCGISACEKEDEGSENIRSSIDLGAVELTFSRLLLLAKNIAPTDGSFNNIYLYTCAAIDSVVGDSADFPLNGPVTVYLTFPDTGCVDMDSREKSGSLSITYHDNLDNVGAVAEIELNDFIGAISPCNGQVNLARTSTSTFDVSFVDCSMSGSITVIEYSGSSTVSQVEGSETRDPADDEYTYTSVLECVNKEGTFFNASTVFPIEINSACPWNVSGQFNVDPDERNDEWIDYGQGVCDGDMLVTVSGNEQTVILP